MFDMCHCSLAAETHGKYVCDSKSLDLYSRKIRNDPDGEIDDQRFINPNPRWISWTLAIFSGFVVYWRHSFFRPEAGPVTRIDIERLGSVVDGFSLMTYDFSNPSRYE